MRVTTVSVSISIETSWLPRYEMSHLDSYILIFQQTASLVMDELHDNASCNGDHSICQAISDELMASH
jgi:hypothetical protein